MNELIKQLQNRRSVREFTGEKIKEEDLKTILATAQRAANSVNGQQTSLIVVRDKEKLAKIAELCGGQKHIAQADAFVFVLVDFHRGVYASNSLGKRNIAPKSADGISRCGNCCKCLADSSSCSWIRKHCNWCN
ncbi:nitroreductase family protein [uncultured Leptotrichia sp.]|uniref:nitroreductase family protein n=1 Tax=uncultured Leptotrichia sp. TaxID=159271 RepID=UPI0026354589|nr:nitroreductase family protein [uncultured Leptotrichia sp.]